MSRAAGQGQESGSGYKKKTHKCCTRAIFNCFRLLHALSQGVLKWWSPDRKRSGLHGRNRTFKRGGGGRWKGKEFSTKVPVIFFGERVADGRLREL